MNLMTIDESDVSAKLSESSFLALEFNGITIRVTDRTSIELLAKVLGVIAHVNDATCFKQVYIVCGYTDLRSGIDKLTAVIDAKTRNSPYVPDTLYLFCGRKIDRIKGLVWEKDGFLLLYKRLEQGKFVWPRNEPEVQALTPQQFC